MPEFTGDAAEARRWLAVFAVCVAALFLLVNRPAYKSFFSDDDFDNLANARDADLKGFALTLVNPNTGGDGQFRATAYFYYYALVRWAGLRYVPYVAGIHALHFLNVLLLWWLARAMGAEIVGACGAALLYAFHAAAFDIYWKPMYVFDLMCATMTLASLLAYVRGWTVLSVVLFWLSLKSKEVTILFPLVVLVWEVVNEESGVTSRESRERKPAWRRLWPFFAISAMVGGIAMGRNSGRDDAYTLRLTGVAVWQCVRYYSSQVAMIPYAGLALAAVWFARKHARVVWGVLAFVLLLGPLLVLPGRLFAAYLYTPMLGLAVAFSVVTRVRWLALFFLLWLPWNYWNFRTARREAQTIAEHRRAWFTPVAAFVRGHPEIDTFVYDGTPDAMPHHAVAGALRLLHPGPGIRVVPLERGWDALSAEHLAEFVWDPARLSLYLLPRVPDVSYIHLDEHAPVWQLTSGWMGNQGHLRWMRPRASVRLLRPEGAKEFEIQVDVVLRGVAERHMEVTLDGAPLGTIRFTKETPAAFRLPVPAGRAGIVNVELLASPAMPDPGGGGELGQPILALGFPVARFPARVK